MSTATTATWYFDFVSPFAYLQLEQFERLPPTLTIEPRPIVLGALLAHWGQKAPAEIAAKRVFTYRHAQYRADKLGIPFRMPPAHPFNPIKPLRLAIAMGGSLD
ncbi:DsbA family protein, partial [Burkholderia ubonensis]